jgi:hypothetical protein
LIEAIIRLKAKKLPSNLLVRDAINSLYEEVFRLEYKVLKGELK